ncbi:3-isopropylmalate dehydratase small subunit [Sinorhizobium mexicanum]|uniref:3-isopropylmalate dehydratase small subunit n=1 Tax=Sinorhizobium mexicanum TaxID=375549 RepID=A0A859QQN1_9HYPH|nr:3-isopropylmalate dehydratase small subunit [Sinorhizobium mexicanum]MBP1888096.1 3-isopropylmalate/(R)-2-methylmalate dehydratase small subunit [Sinorhizobium mexicanum]QLL65705.1 3-isopropylmalate dehydratase small subunit [Sinorhizobium mexicanum]
MPTFTTVTGEAAPFMLPNVDTDVIMPKQFLKGVDRQGLDVGVFHALRFDESGAVRPEFILNQAPWQEAAFLVVGPNFGCGSSREHAVWGLMQLGIRALIGTSFAGIFNDNCQRNGLLTISLEPETVAKLADLAETPGANRFTIDLPGQTMRTGDTQVSFDIDPLRKDAIVRGLDAVRMTLESADEIRSFEERHFRDNPWFA